MNLEHYSDGSNSEELSEENLVRPGKKIRVYGALVTSLILFLNTTLAGNMNLGIRNVEFGQGILVGTICDDEVRITPESVFINSPGGGLYYFSGFKIEGVDIAKCAGVTFTLKAYDSMTAVPLTLFGTTSHVGIMDSGTSLVRSEHHSGITLSDTMTQGSASVNFLNPIALTSSIYRITLESSRGSSVSNSAAFRITYHLVNSDNSSVSGGSVPVDALTYTSGASGLALANEVISGNIGYIYPVSLIGHHFAGWCRTNDNVNPITCRTGVIPAGTAISNINQNIDLYPVWNLNTLCTSGVCNIGDTGPGGGIVIYSSVGGFTVNGVTKHNLEVSPVDLNGGNPSAWCDDTTNPSGASGTAIGTGYSNTLSMLTSSGFHTACSSGAGYLASRYAGNDSSAGQWYLPSRDELNLIYLNANKANLSAQFYWSSSDVTGYGPVDAYILQYAGNVGIVVDMKSRSYWTRAVRAF